MKYVYKREYVENCEVMADTDCASESASSVCDEERVRKLFQACDADGDGYIDSHDLLAVCRELSLEDSLDELMLQLGADAQGRISYEQFLQRRLALRPEIDALKGPTLRDTASENSQGKVDSWEWDSGARDLSPVPQLNRKTASSHFLEPMIQERVKQQLEEQAQRYEEQLTELHSVIAELTRKLHQQRAMAITEEDEASEICTSAHEDSITCPLEVSELEPMENDLSDTETKLPLADSPLELPDPKLNTSQHETNDISSRDEIDALKTELQLVRAQLLEAQTKLTQSITPEPLLYPKTIETIPESPLENDENLENDDSDAAVFLSDEKLNIKSSTIVPIHKSTNSLDKKLTSTIPVAKMAERVRLRRATEDDRVVSTIELVNSGLSTAVAEHLVGDILRQCDQPEKQALEMELRRLNAKLEHVKAQNTVLALTLTETKEHCDRLALLCGKYESNAIALRLALGISDRAIEAYDVLLALLETELTIDQNEQDTIENRAAAEGVAKQLLAHLDMHQSSDVLLSPWQHSIYPNSTTNGEPWTAEHETRLREHVSRLKQERSSIQGTYVTLESTHLEHFPRVCSTQESRKMDLEMAVLMQELMSLREDKAELLTKLFMLEKEKGSTELKLKYVDGQQRAQAAALKNLQGQLKDTEALLVLATQNKERGYSDAEHAQGVELELMQALARESRLKLRLQELVATLEQVTKNAEQRLLEGRELVHDLNQTNSVLVETVDRNYRKYQNRLKKMEHQMLTLVDRHSSQVENLKQRIATLETPVHQINSSGNSETSIYLEEIDLRFDEQKSKLFSLVYSNKFSS